MPAADSGYLEPVCGCDGFTYYNPTLAALNAEPVRDGGPCNQDDPDTRPCAPSGAFRTNGNCARGSCDLGGAGSVSGVGRCWILPDDCTDDRTYYCNIPRQLGEMCVHGECNAIRSDAPWRITDAACE